MKIAVAFPPIHSDKGVPTLAGNRQFQYYREPTFVYPLLPAQLATMLKDEGHEVLWLDAIAEGLEVHSFYSKIMEFKPDVVFLEAKAPTFKATMRVRDRLITLSPDCNVKIYGDYPRFLGIDDIGYEEIPFKIDRELTKWWLYAYKNGNFRRTPATYINASRDCWYNKCTFCSWATYFPRYRCRTPLDWVDEIEQLYILYNMREFMDDSGTFPTGDWLRTACSELIRRGLNNKVSINCNMRFGLSLEEYKLMKKAGFRMVLFGVESMNKRTLDRLKKGITPEMVVEGLKNATSAGLKPHIAVMFGFPFESKSQAWCTVKAVRWLLKKGYAYTAQATTCIPYPNTPLFKECQRNNWLLTHEIDDYDMSKPVMKCDYDPQECVKAIYSVMFSPIFILRKLLSIREWVDVAYLWRNFIKVYRNFFYARVPSVVDEVKLMERERAEVK